MTKSHEEIPLTPISSMPSTVTLTGKWRVLKPKLDRLRCKKCTLCWKFCPDAVIKLVDGYPEIDFVHCKGCGICAHECPSECIEMVREGAE